MRRLLTARFEIQKVSKDSAQTVSFLGLDRWDNIKPVFVKFLASGAYPPDARLRDRMTQLHGLQHPFLAGVFDAVLTRRRDLYVTRPFVEGAPLTNCGGHIDTVAALVSSCAFLRSRDIVHGRLKPENAILRSDGTVVIVDAGLPAPLAQSDSSRLSFAAPEVIAGQAPNLDSDLYSLGALLYRLLSGTDVFEDANAELLRNKCVTAVPAPLGERCSVPESIGNAVDMLLSKAPPERRSGFELIQTAVPVRLLPARRVAFTGRGTELSRMLEELRPGGRGMRVLVIEGETGAGKTRTIEHLGLLRSLEGGYLLKGRSFERDNRQFEPLLQILDERLRRRDQKIQKWLTAHVGDYGRSLAFLLPACEWLPEIEGDADSKPSRGKLVADLVGSLVSLFEGDPTLIVALDDLHWADEGTLEVLEQLGWRAGSGNARILAAIRKGRVAGSAAELLAQFRKSLGSRFSQLRLAPLSRGASHEIVDQLLSDRDRIDWIVDEASGNPLFVEEYARAIAHGRNTSETVRDVLETEVSSLPVRQKEVAEALSLFDKPLSLEVAVQLLNSLDLGPEQVLDELVSREVLQRTTTDIRFRHDGIRRTVYRLIASARRKKLHSGALTVLTRLEAVDSVRAFHAAQAGLHEQAAISYERAAADHALSGDYGTAIGLYSKSKGAYERAGMSTPTETLWSYARALIAGGLTKNARLVLDSLLSMHHDSAEARALIYQNLASCHSDNPQLYLKCAALALGHLPQGSPLEPKMRLHLAQAQAIAGNASEARRILASVREGELDDPVNETALRGITLLALCDHSRAFQQLEALKATPDSASARLSNNRAVCLEHLGLVRDALRCQKKTLSLSRRLGLLSVELQSLVNLGAFKTKSGAFMGGRSFFEEAERAWMGMRLHDNRGRAPLPLLAADKATLMMEMGEYGSARKLIATAIRQLKTDNSSQKAIWVAIRAAELYTRTEEHGRASDALHRVIESELFDSDFFTVERALITRLQTHGDASDRANLLNHCLELTEVLQTLHQRCRVLLALGATWTHLNDTPRARDCLAEAKELALRHGYKPLSARIALRAAYAAESDEERLALLASAHRQAAKLGLPELTAESGFRIGQVQARSGHLRKAHEHLVKSSSSIDTLAATLPRSFRRRYLRRDWRVEVKACLDEVARQVRSSRDGPTKQPQRREDRLFKLTYQHSVRLNSVTTVEDLVSALNDAVTSVVRADATVFLDARGSREVFSSGQPVDEALTRAIARLHKKAHNDLFVGGDSHNDTTATSFLWAPLKFQHHRFGGIYAPLPTSITEKQIEFLTTLAMNASSTLAALLWSTELSVDPVGTPRYGGIIGRSAAIEGICAQIDIAAQSGATVLVEGESGTGKELVARAIHENSSRSNGPFIAVDCGAIPETLIESEFFGSQRGSFTGATTDRVGLIESSDGGTLFLDEISNTSPPLQAKLLRVLQEREIRRLGDTKGRKVDLRLIAATNANLDQLVEQSAFRQDLLYRLKVLHIVIPPLRQRLEDIPEIAQVFLARLNSAHGTRKRFHNSALQTLSEATYRGNVRELQNVVERAYFSALGQDVITHVGVGEASKLKESSDIDVWFKKLTDGRESFWQSVHARYKSRDISREKVLELMDVGLRASRGSYKNLAMMLNVEEREYRRFMDFLRRNNCQPDFRPYRRRARDRGEAPPPKP